MKEFIVFCFCNDFIFFSSFSTFVRSEADCSVFLFFRYFAAVQLRHPNFLSLALLYYTFQKSSIKTAVAISY